MKRTSLIFIILLVTTIRLISSSSEEIRSRIQAVIDRLPASTKASILIYQPLTGDTIYSVNHKLSMIPASNVKLFTTATALEIMGSDYELSTQILSDDNELSDSVVNGNIFIKGLGNSTFTTEDLDSLVGVLKHLGIKNVTGNIVGDDKFFDDVYVRDDWITDERANVTLPPISALVIDRNTKIVQRKRWGRWRRYKVNIDNPPKYIAEMLKNKLLDSGITVIGNVQTGKTPSTANMICQSTISLHRLLSLINKHSDNFLAECLFKTIGAVSSGKQGNSFFSTQTILSFIEDNAIYSKGSSIVDGSGISRFDQITVGAIVGLLSKMYFDLQNFEDFYNSLSIAGIDGTLEDRMDSGEYINFRGKTGTLNGVSSLSGYLTTKNDDELIVSMIFEFNRGGARTYRNIQDRIIAILNDWSEEEP